MLPPTEPDGGKLGKLDVVISAARRLHWFQLGSATSRLPRRLGREFHGHEGRVPRWNGPTTSARNHTSTYVASDGARTSMWWRSRWATGLQRDGRHRVRGRRRSHQTYDHWL